MKSPWHFGRVANDVIEGLTATLASRRVLDNDTPLEQIRFTACVGIEERMDHYTMLILETISTCGSEFLGVEKNGIRLILNYTVLYWACDIDEERALAHVEVRFYNFLIFRRILRRKNSLNHMQ